MKGCDFMLCTNCKSKEANFHYKQIINGKQTQLNLCTDCARELGYLSQNEGWFDFPSFFGDFISMPSFAPAKSSSPACPACQTTLKEFMSSGFAGCEKCYDEFKDAIESALGQIQPSTTHKGSLGGEAGAKIKKTNELSSLKEQLKRAVIDEKYEDAAILRDKIKKLEEEEKHND